MRENVHAELLGRMPREDFLAKWPPDRRIARRHGDLDGAGGASICAHGCSVQVSRKTIGY